MFKFSFNSTTLRDMDVFSALRNIKDYGYDGVELTLNDSHLHPLTSSTQRARDIRQFCQDNAINIVCLAAGGDRLLSDVRYEPSLICASPSGRAQRLDLLRRTMDIARVIEAPVVNFNSGLPTDLVDRQQATEHLQEAVSALLADADGLILVLEPEPDFFIGTTTAAIDLITTVNHPNLRLNLDIGHVFCSEANPYEAIDRALPFSRHVHIEDIKNRIHHHEIPGDGDIDFLRVAASVKKAGYQHFISVELHHHNDRWKRALGESLAYLRALDEVAA